MLKCKLCGNELKRSPAAYRENPFCVDCVDERIERSGGKKFKSPAIQCDGSGHCIVIDKGQDKEGV